MAPAQNAAEGWRDLGRWCPFILFCVFFVAWIGFQPVAIRGEGDMRLASIEAGGGDTAKQIAFAVLFLASAFIAWRAVGLRGLADVPFGLVVVFAWCALSVVWAIDPSISARRTIFAVMAMLCTVYVVRRMSAETFLSVLFWTGVVILALDWIFLALFTHAVHQDNGPEIGLVGLWRGAHIHKNEAGAFCAISLIAILHAILRDRIYIIGLALMAAAGAFMLGTESKTSLGFIGIALATGLAARLTWRHRNVQLLGLTILSVALAVAVNLLPVWLDDVAEFLDDPAALTGRTQIWSIVIAYLRDNPLFGAGYGSFWAIGDTSPAFDYASGWVAKNIDHTHNGYLTLAAEIGLIGLAITVVAVLLAPLHALFTSDRLGPERFTLTALLVFVMLRDCLEDSLVDRANPAWIVVVAVITLVSRVSLADVVRDLRQRSRLLFQTGASQSARSAR